MQAVSVGRLWDVGKNLALLLKAPIDLPVFVAGEHSVNNGGAWHPPASGQREDANRQLCFMGALESGQVRTLMRESAMYIATSLYEPFGLAPLEAALAGCALVLSDIPTFREIWADAAVFFDPHDAQGLACAVHRLAVDQRQLRRIAAAGQARAIHLYAAETMIARYLHLYATVQLPAQEDAFVA
jgi:glycogen synthase